MSDGHAVFSSSNHANLAGSGAVISETTLTAGRLALRTQVDQNGTLIAATPRYFLVPPALETLAEKTISQVQATQTSNVNTFTFLQLLVESRLTDATAYYLVADPAMVDGLEYAYLAGEEGPQLFSEIGFASDGISYKVREDFACAFVEPWGWFKNPGRIRADQWLRASQICKTNSIKLNRARASGTRSMTYTGNGVTRTVEYRSDQEMQAAQLDLQRRIAALSGATSRTVRVSTSKGLGDCDR